MIVKLTNVFDKKFGIKKTPVSKETYNIFVNRVKELREYVKDPTKLYCQREFSQATLNTTLTILENIYVTPDL